MEYIDQTDQEKVQADEDRIGCIRNSRLQTLVSRLVANTNQFTQKPKLKGNATNLKNDVQHARTSEEFA